MTLSRPSIIIGFALLIKIFLFLFAEIHYPHSKFLPDSASYLKTEQLLMSHGVFTVQDQNRIVHDEFRRTPGYPIFLGVLNGLMGIPLGGVVLIQVLLSIVVALIVYKTAIQIDPKLGFLSAIFILYSPIISIYSLIILTEILFLFFITIFMFYFVRYLKNGEIKFLLASSLMLVLAAYVRPGAYFLGMFMVIFVIYSNVSGNFKKTLCHAFILLVVVYGLLGVWQIRNYVVFKNPAFSSIFQEDSGFFKDYSGETSPVVRIKEQCQYYGGHILHGASSLMTRPGSFKYLHCHTLTILGKVFGYPWMVFWMTGFLYGVTKIGRNVYYQFFLLIILCFIGGSLIGAPHSLGGRFRIPMEPFIAILSAYGWRELTVLAKAGIAKTRG